MGQSGQAWSGFGVKVNGWYFYGVFGVKEPLSEGNLEPGRSRAPGSE